MDCIDFLISQGPIVGAILEPQGHRSLVVSDAFTFVGSDEINADKVVRLLIFGFPNQIRD